MEKLRWSSTYYDSSVLTVELYRLATVYGAGRFITELRKPGDSLGSLYHTMKDFEYTEASRLLVSIAAVARNIMYTYKIDPGLRDASVGEIIKEGKTSSIKFLDACSKILHAQYIRPNQTGKVPDKYGGSIIPRATLYEWVSGDGWQVKLNIPEFIQCAYNII